MLTRCPACDTTFRVTPEQLKVRAGRVRCGQCQHAFNAIDTLIEESIATATPIPALPEIDVPKGADGIDAIEQMAVWTAPSFTIDTTVCDFSVIPSDAKLEKPEDTTPVPTPEDAPPSESLAAELTENVIAESANDAATDIVEQPEPLADSLLAEQVHKEPYRWPWIIGALLTMLVLLIQAIVAFRVEIAVLLPEARPELTQLCSLIGCEVGLPRKVELLSIETSDLHPDTEKKGRLGLTATLKNRAPFAQTLPHLELTLTDAADKAIARKILKPVEYLPPKTKLATGMAANADLAVSVDIDPGDLSASGYRLYLFYP